MQTNDIFEITASLIQELKELQTNNECGVSWECCSESQHCSYQNGEPRDVICHWVDVKFARMYPKRDEQQYMDTDAYPNLQIQHKTNTRCFDNYPIITNQP